MDISVNYLGLKLPSPIIAGSCGLTNSLQDIKLHEQNGAGAVVLKSLFEEEIMIELENSKAQMNRPVTIYPEIYDFFDYDTVEDSVSKYLSLIESCKKEIKIPIVASINCISSDEWIGFARRLESAGADALELNMFILPSDFERTTEQNESVYFDVINRIKSEIKIPVALKISYYFSNLGTMIKKLSESGIDGIVLFNRFFSPDFNIDNFSITSSSVFSGPGDLTLSLRWIAIMAERVKCDLCASTGVHDAPALIKQLLAGANAVQIASVLYKQGPSAIKSMINGLKEWMLDHGFDSIDDFRGKMSQSRSSNPAAYERAQFMKHFSGKW